MRTHRSACIQNSGLTRRSGGTSGWGHSRRFRDAPKESGSPPIADKQRLLRRVRSVPTGDSCTAAMTTVIWLPLVGVGDLQSENIATAVLSYGRDLSAASAAVVGGRFPTGTSLHRRDLDQNQHGAASVMGPRGMRLMAKVPYGQKAKPYAQKRKTCLLQSRQVS
jgi:hypothetical protein